MTRKFKELVEASIVSVSGFKDSHAALCVFFGLELTDSFSEQLILDHLRNQIDIGLKADINQEGIRRKHLKDIEAELVYESVIEDIDNSLYLTLLRTIDANQQFRPLSEEAAWIQALSNARDLNCLSPDIYRVEAENLRNQFAKRYDIAVAARELSQLGCVITYDGSQIICQAGLKEVVLLLEGKIVKYGAAYFISAVFDTLIANNCYFVEYRRYVVRNNITFGACETTEMAPYGYLLNLAVKHLTQPSIAISNKQREVLLAEIDHLAKLIATIADARQYSTWESHFQNADTILDSIRSHSLFDTIYAFPCTNLSVVISYMEHLFDWVCINKFERFHGFSLADVVAVTKQLDRESADTGLQIVYTSTLSRALKHIDRAKIQKILDRMAHDPEAINRGFFLTEDYDKVDFIFKPLVKLSPTKFLLCDKSWCASGIYEVLASMVRELDSVGNESNIKIGLSLELYIRRRLMEKGVKFAFGAYVDNTIARGEADVIVEADDSVTLIEIKKEVFTRRARTGSVIAALIDLASSLLDAQIQTGRTEILLRQQGYIDLNDGSKDVRINLNNRDIERIALTQWDYGSFQDRSVINSILTILMTNEVTLLNQEQKNDVDSFKKIDKQRRVHEEQAVKLMQLDPTFNHYPYFNCSFLSVPQLLAILDFSSDADEFNRALRSTRFVTIGSNNFYFEFYYNFLLPKKNIQSRCPGS